MNQSEKQKGSPRANEEAAQLHSVAAGSDGERGGEPGELIRGCGRILVMDDEETIRDVAGRVLRAAGYEVECAAEGNEAVDLYRKAAEEGRPFDVVILDVTVPGGAGGKETVKRLLEINQSVKAIVSSGYYDDPIMSNYRDYGFKGVIAKPYKIRDLSETVRRVLDEGASKSGR